MSPTAVRAGMAWPAADSEVPRDSRYLHGPSLFLFVCWVTVNVHHYFMDSVMWRRDNPKVKQHLFC